MSIASIPSDSNTTQESEVVKSSKTDFSFLKQVRNFRIARIIRVATTQGKQENGCSSFEAGKTQGIFLKVKLFNTFKFYTGNLPPNKGKILKLYKLNVAPRLCWDVCMIFWRRSFCFRKRL